jgi:hypothetical protein
MDAHAAFLENRSSGVSAYDVRGVSLNFNAPTTIETEHGTFRIPILRKGTLQDLRYDPFSLTLVGEPGLKEYIRMDRGDSIITVVDSHNFAFYAWIEAFHEGRIRPGATLLHFDQHADARISPVPIDSMLPLDQIAAFTSRLTIEDFIQPAIQANFFSRAEYINAGFSPYENSYSPGRQGYSIPLHQVGMFGQTIKQFCDISCIPYDLAVDIDIDYFSGTAWGNKSRNEWDATMLDRYRQSIAIMRKIIAKAGVVTIATSPSYFKDQIDAIEIVKDLLR